VLPVFSLENSCRDGCYKFHHSSSKNYLLFDHSQQLDPWNWQKLVINKNNNAKYPETAYHEYITKLPCTGFYSLINFISLFMMSLISNVISHLDSMRPPPLQLSIFMAAGIACKSDCGGGFFF